MRNTFLVFFICLFCIVSCSTQNTIAPPYNGNRLIIGIIGNPPEIRENNIKFHKISFKELENSRLLSSFDAVMIMKEHLSEAAESKYAKVYKQASIPFFFVQSTKAFIPFTEEDLSYENTPEIDEWSYAAGYRRTPEGIDNSWSFGLYNDKVTKENILDVYSRIFTVIETESKKYGRF